MFRLSIIALCVIGLVFPVLSFPQEDRASIDKSRIPMEGNSVNDFVPPGWKLEEQVAGDLNGDSSPDYALKLVEDKPAKNADDTASERQRALVIVLKNKAGKLSRAGVADKLLQCTTCGGAFYGVMEAPANVKIEKGVLTVEQDHGSREMTDLTYRFRYEPGSNRFALIGFDITSHDRLTTEVVSESTNYLTGVRVIFRGKGKSDKSSRKIVPTKKIYIEQVDDEAFEEAASKRLGM
ncbi:MAG: hypothetical protein QOH63_1279 [Acidobacteriota bacterium]|jgi:hypothetical protein|nr:hypothetical protein [Acidobacteriota bacterium]